MPFIHKNLLHRWHELSFMEQMANIGSEVNRAARWQNKNKKLFESAIVRTLELLDFTISDPRWRKRLKELTRSREIFCDAISGGREYKSSLADLDRYFFHFAMAARSRK